MKENSLVASFLSHGKNKKDGKMWKVNHLYFIQTIVKSRFWDKKMKIKSALVDQIRVILLAHFMDLDYIRTRKDKESLHLILKYMIWKKIKERIHRWKENFYTQLKIIPISYKLNLLKSGESVIELNLFYKILIS